MSFKPNLVWSYSPFPCVLFVFWPFSCIYMKICLLLWRKIRDIYTSQSLSIVIISFSNSGKCLADSGRVHLAHEALLHSISVLFKSNRSSHKQPSVSELLVFIGKEAKGDVFAIDRAIILYNLCWLSLRNYHCRESRYVWHLLVLVFSILPCLSFVLSDAKFMPREKSYAELIKYTL